MCSNVPKVEQNKFVPPVVLARNRNGGGRLLHCTFPLPESCRVVLDAEQHRAGTVDQHATQIDVTAFADCVEA